MRVTRKRDERASAKIFEMTHQSIFAEALQNFFALGDPVDDRVENSLKSARTETRFENLKLERVAREKNLRAVFPEKIAPATAYKFLTAGDVDALSFVIALIDRYGYFDECHFSTWTMSRADCELIDARLTDGKIKKITFFIGESLQQRETATYATLIHVLQKHGGRLRCFRNHCKILLFRNDAANAFISMESSANFSTNPRAENHSLTNDEKLWTWYRDWFERTFAKPDGGTYNYGRSFGDGRP